MMSISDKLRIGLFIPITIILIVTAMGFNIAYAQLEEFFDPNDPNNLTKVCNNYINSPLGSRAPDAQAIVMCSNYLNQTMLDRFGIVK
jgi:hypothetical protein